MEEHGGRRPYGVFQPSAQGREKESLMCVCFLVPDPVEKYGNNNSLM
jgi:hypothetical protein